MMVNKLQVYFNSSCCLYMCATCFGLCLGHPQASQYKTLTKDDTIRFKGALCLQSPFFIMLEHRI